MLPDSGFCEYLFLKAEMTFNVEKLTGIQEEEAETMTMAETGGVEAIENTLKGE
jgi:hypothetical protein